MEIFLVSTVLAFCGWVYYRLQKKIDEEQATDWEDFKKEHSEYFEPPKKESLVHSGGGWTKQERKKFLEGVWARYYARHQ